jgi:hypothetical protein
MFRAGKINFEGFERSDVTEINLLTGKCKFVSVHALKVYGGVELSLHSFLTSLLDTGERDVLVAVA